MAGRKRQAVAVMELTKKPHRSKADLDARKAAEIKVPEGEFIPPDTLSPSQEEEFYEIAAWMQEVNSRNKAHGAIYCDRDSEGIAQYIICKDLAHGYQKGIIDAESIGDAALEKHNAALHLKYCDMARKYASDIGLDYLSRMKRSGPLRDAGDDDYGGF